MALNGSAGKRGQGLLLLLVLSAAAVLTVVGLRQLFSASALTAQTARTSSGSHATELAESAVQEGIWQFSRQANDPATNLFHELRKTVLAPHPGALALEKEIQLDVLPAMLGKPAHRDFTLERFDARVVYQRQFEDLAFERFGLVRFLARVRGGGAAGAKVTREVELARGFKLVLAGAPRPFDQCALYVGDGSNVTDLTGVNARRKRYLDASGAILSFVSEFAGKAPPALAARYQEIKKSIPARQSLEKSVPELPVHPGSILFAVWRQDQQFPLESLDLDAKLEADEKSFIPAAAKLEGAKAGLAQSPSDPAAHKAFLDALDVSLANLSKLMGRIWAFHEGFRMIDSSEKAYAEIASQQERFSLAHWQRVAFFRLKSGDRGLSAQAQFDALVKRYDPLNGIVLVENDKEPLRLSGNLKGKLVVVVTGGGAVLDAVNKRDRPQDLLTVVALGGPVTLSGEVHAQVASFSPGGTVGPGPVVMEAGTSLKGGLLLERVATGSKLAGRLIRDSKYGSGLVAEGAANRPVETHYVCGLSPIDTYERLGRK